MRKLIIWMVLVAFVVGAVGSITFDRVIIPRLSNIKGLSGLRKLLTNSPIVITKQERVEIDAGINTREMIKQAQGYTVSLYTGAGDNLKYLANGLILTADGVIFTSKSALNGATQLSVVANDGKTFSGLVRALDPKSDIAVVTVVGQNLTVAPFDDASKMEISERLFALGRSVVPFSRTAVVGNLTTTVANSANPDQSLSSELVSETFSSSLALNADFTGGPIVNSKGRVVSMVTNGGTKLITAEALNQALSTYLSSNKIQRPYLGITYQSYSEEIAALKGLPAAGIKVLTLAADSPAKAAGLKPGDFVTAIDGTGLQASGFERAFNQRSAGAMKLTFVRDGQEQTISFNIQTK